MPASGRTHTPKGRHRSHRPGKGLRSHDERLVEQFASRALTHGQRKVHELQQDAPATLDDEGRGLLVIRAGRAALVRTLADLAAAAGKTPKTFSNQKLHKRP